MANSPEMRASDADRDRVAAILREHTAQGRITMDEFNDRLEQLYTSKTYGELAKLTADLPDVDLRHRAARQAEVAAKKSELPAKKQGMHTGMRAAWAAWAVVSGLNWVIWVLVTLSADDAVDPWPLWVMLPWAVVLAISSAFSSSNEKNR